MRFTRGKFNIIQFLFGVACLRRDESEIKRPLSALIREEYARMSYFREMRIGGKENLRRDI